MPSLLVPMLLLVEVASAADPATEQVRADAAAKVLDQVKATHASGRATAEDVYRWSLRVMEAERALGRPAAASDHHQRMLALQATVRDLVARGMAAPLDGDAAAFYVAEAKALLQGGVALGGPDPLDPGFVPPPPAPVLLGPAEDTADLDACFERCDAEQQACSTTAEHFRLGVGALDPGDAVCAKQAEDKCGTARNQAATSCRDQANRSCQAARRAEACTLEQTRCAARCR